MAEKPIRAIIYARISDDSEGREAGVSRQVEDCKRLAERLGWTLHPDEMLVDNDISASTKSKKRRPSWDKLLEGVSVGEYDGILYYSNSRLTRRPREYETVIELVNDTGVRLASVASGQADLSTADGRMIGRFLAAQDAAEAERISERVTRAFEGRRVKDRLPAPSRRCYGYKAGGTEIEPEEAENVRFAASQILDGASLGAAVRELDLRGSKPIYAQAWSRMTLRRILLSPRTAGMVEHKGKNLGDGDFQGILTKEVWDAVGKKIRDRSHLQRGEYKGVAVHLLAGFMFCGLCGKPIKVNAMREEDGSLRKDSFIVCSRTQHGCGRIKRNLRHVEDFVIRRVLTELAEAPSFDPIAENTLEAVEAAALATQIDTLEASIVAVRTAFTSGGPGALDPVDYAATLRGLRENLTNAKAQLAEFSLNEIVDREEQLQEWVDGDVEERREILQSLGLNIIIHPVGKVGPIAALAAMPESVQITLYR